jgi:hypothetical protein
MKLISLLSVGAIIGAGCTVMVNGKPRRIGGGGDDPPPVTASTPTATTPPAAPDGKQPPPPPPGTAVVLRADATLARDPIVAQTSAAFDTTFSHVFGFSAKHDCRASDLPSRPVASIDIASPGVDLAIAVHGHHGMQEGFVLRVGDRYWEACDATLRAPKGGFPPGRYDIYPYQYVHENGAVPFDVEIYAPEAKRTWSERVQKVTIAGKLAKPMFVEVTTAKNRRALRDEHAGNGCSKAAFASEPDVAITVERELPGLVVRPLPTEMPVLLRRELADGKNENQRYCQRGGGERGHGPTYRADSEIGLAKQEGTFGISVGTADPAHETKVTLMIFDDSTVFDPAAVVPFGSDALSINDRVLARQFPQLDVRDLGLRDYTHAELTARVFATAPRHAFVYAKHDFDKDLVGGPGPEYPKRDEPLLVVDASADSTDVLAADGLTYRVKTSHLVAAPSGPIAVLATPRAIDPAIDTAIAMLPPEAHALVDAHRARLAKWDTCRERAWAPFGRQLPSITRPAGVDLVVVKSPATQRIEEAGERAMDQQCGTEEARDKQTEATRKKMLVEIGKARARLLAHATAGFRT